MKFTLFIPFIITATILLSVFLSTLGFHKVYAHIFISDDDASSFLTLLEKITIEALMANNTVMQNVTNSQEYLSRLIESIDDISDDENDFEISYFTNKDILFATNQIEPDVRNGMSTF
jgi:hypothetical protein